MEMIAAGDFDAAEENAAPAEASTNENSDQPTGEAVDKEEEKAPEVVKEASEVVKETPVVVEKSKEMASDEDKKEEQEAEGKDEVGSG